MRQRLLVTVLAPLAATLALASSAHAGGGYLSGGIGGGAGLDGNIATSFQTDDSNSARFSLGQRIGPVALEASLFGAGLVGRQQFVGYGSEYDTLSLGVDLKYYFSLVGPLELYPKIGINKTWLLEPSDSQHDYDGTGWDIGGGVQFTFDTAASMVAIWLDYTQQRTDLRDPGKRDLDGRVSMLTLGLSVGF
jgi:hypothetical protein